MAKTGKCISMVLWGLALLAVADLSSGCSADFLKKHVPGLDPATHSAVEQPDKGE